MFSLVLRQSLELETALPLGPLAAWTPGVSLLTFLGSPCCLQSPETSHMPSSLSVLFRQYSGPYVLAEIDVTKLSCQVVPLIFTPLEVFISFFETH